MTSLLWLNNVAKTLVWKGLKHNVLKKWPGKQERPGPTRCNYFRERCPTPLHASCTVRVHSIMDTGFNKIWAFLVFIYLFIFFFLGGGGGLSDISRLPNNTSMFVLLCVFGGRDLCLGCNFNLD